MNQAASQPSTESARRKRVGEIAVERGYISAGQLKEALQAQAKLKQLGLSERIGQILYKKKFITQEALRGVLREQAPKLKRLGNFEISEKIGQGAMGVVFKARQISMDRIVALKILAPKWAQDPLFIERFVREARAAGQFSHANIVTALDVGYAEPYHYFAMEYVEGRTLRQVLKERGPLPEKEALAIVRQIAQALAHALAKNIIHRDVKPDNIMLTRSGGVAKLLDLGLACAAGTGSEGEEDEEGADPEKNKRITGDRKAVGTPHYISPEAARGEDLDTRADLYSLGCTLFQTLTGVTPFEGRSGRAIMARHVSDSVPDVRVRNPKITPNTARLVAKMTAKTPEGRYANPDRLIEDLDALLAGRPPRHALPSSRKSVRGRGALTTGPRRPVSPRDRATTGPRVPIGGRGTTGPRRPIHPRAPGVTTGPAAPVLGDRTGKISITVGRESARGRGALPRAKFGAGLWIGAGVGGAAVLALGIAFFSGSARSSAPSHAGGVKKTARGPRGKNGADSTATSRLAPPTQKVAKPVLPSPREALAQEALNAAQEILKNRREDYPALLAAFERAQAAARETPLAARVEAAFRPVRAAWEKALDAALQTARAKAEAAWRKADYAAAEAAWDEQAMAPNLRAGEWRQRLAAERKALALKAETAAVALLEKARAKANPGDPAALQAAIGWARQAEAIGVRWAPSAERAAGEIKKWEAQRKAALEAAEKKQQAQAARGAEQAAAVWKELAPLLRKNRFSAAREMLARKLREPAYAAAQAPLRKEQADLEAIAALRRRAVAALRQRAGEKVSLQKSGAKLRGTIKNGARREGVTIQLHGGPELTLSAGQLEAGDVDRYAPRLQGKAAGEDLRRRGLLFLAAGETAKAKAYFLKARDGGWGAGVALYLKRIEVLELGETEVRARAAWRAITKPDAAAKKSWKDRKASIESFRKTYGATKFALENSLEIKTLLATATEKVLYGDAPRKGLVWWLKLDEGQGATAACSVPKGPSAELKGAAWSKGKFGGALHFDGTNNYAIVSRNLKDAFPDTSVTLAAWIFPEAAGVVLDEVGSGALNAGWHDSQIEVLADGEVKVRVWALSPLSLGKLKFKTWNHVVLRYDQTAQTLDGFLNGIEAGADVKGARKVPWKSNQGLFYALGSADSTNMGSGSFFKGRMDEVRVYNRALSAAEIKTLAGTAAAGPPR